MHGYKQDNDTETIKGEDLGIDTVKNKVKNKKKVANPIVSLQLFYHTRMLHM